MVVINADEELDDIVKKFLEQETLIFNKAERGEDEDTDQSEERIVRLVDTE